MGEVESEHMLGQIYQNQRCVIPLGNGIYNNLGLNADQLVRCIDDYGFGHKFLVFYFLYKISGIWAVKDDD